MSDGSGEAISHGPVSHEPIAGLAPGRRHLLWDNGNGTAAVWRVEPAAGPGPGEVRRHQFGPFAGWAARALAVGPDGRVYLLWAGRDGGASLWSVDMEDGGRRHWEFGACAGWAARTLAVGPDDVVRVLWTGPGGRAALWSLREGKSPESLDCGPFAGWAAVSLSVGADNWAQMLWTGPGGAASVWRVGADGQAEQAKYGPFAGWRAVAVASAGRGGAGRLLWQGAGGLASLWDMPGGQGPGGDTTGGEVSPPDRQPQAVHGPFEGWTPASVALGADEAAHVLWRFDGGGLASVWRMMGSEEVMHAEYGPFAGWVPVALALGP